MQNNFEEIAEDELFRIFEILEKDDNLEVNFSEGVLTIIAPNGEYAINKHLATKQIWFSSPVSSLKYFILQDGIFVEKKSLQLTLEEAIFTDLKK